VFKGVEARSKEEQEARRSRELRLVYKPYPLFLEGSPRKALFAY
jgi:hypothetical protein